MSLSKLGTPLQGDVEKVVIFDQHSVFSHGCRFKILDADLCPRLPPLNVRRTAEERSLYVSTVNNDSPLAKGAPLVLAFHVFSRIVPGKKNPFNFPSQRYYAFVFLQAQISTWLGPYASVWSVTSGLWKG